MLGRITIGGTVLYRKVGQPYCEAVVSVGLPRCGYRHTAFFFMACHDKLFEITGKGVGRLNDLENLMYFQIKCFLYIVMILKRALNSRSRERRGE